MKLSNTTRNLLFKEIQTTMESMEKLVKMVSEIKTQIKEQKKDIEENKN